MVTRVRKILTSELGVIVVKEALAAPLPDHSCGLLNWSINEVRKLIGKLGNCWTLMEWSAHELTLTSFTFHESKEKEDYAKLRPHIMQNTKIQEDTKPIINYLLKRKVWHILCGNRGRLGASLVSWGCVNFCKNGTQIWTMIYEIAQNFLNKCTQNQIKDEAANQLTIKFLWTVQEIIKYRNLFCQLSFTSSSLLSHN